MNPPTKTQPIAPHEWAMEAAKEIRKTHYAFNPDVQMVEPLAAIIARHAPVNAVEGVEDGKARYFPVARKDAIMYAAYCSGRTGKAIRVAENTVPEFIECAKELGLEPVEMPDKPWVVPCSLPTSKREEGPGDGEMLDWLLKRGLAWKGCYGPMGDGLIWESDEWLYSGKGLDGLTGRECIRAAMKSETDA